MCCLLRLEGERFEIVVSLTSVDGKLRSKARDAWGVGAKPHLAGRSEERCHKEEDEQCAHKVFG
jgi:hypothetical protein